MPNSGLIAANEGREPVGRAKPGDSCGVSVLNRYTPLESRSVTASDLWIGSTAIAVGVEPAATGGATDTVPPREGRGASDSASEHARRIAQESFSVFMS